MRIGIDCRSYGPTNGYIGKYLEYFISYIIENDKENKYVLFFLDREFGDFKSQSKHIQTIRTSARKGSLKEQFLFTKELYKEKLDLMLFTEPNIPFFYSRKSITIISDLVSYFYPEKNLKGSWMRHLHASLLRRSIHKSASIIVLNEVLKRDIIEIFDTPEEKIQVVPPMCPEIQPREEKEILQFLKKEGIGEKYILSVGELREYKNIPRLLQSYDALLKEKLIDADLVLIGKEDPTYHEIRSTLIQLGLQNRIHIYNVLDEEKLAFFYQNASLYILPSLYEGSEENILLPLAHNLNIASANLPSLTLAIGKDRASFFRPMSISDMQEALKKEFGVLSQKKTTKDMSMFSIHNVSKKILDVFALYKKDK